MKKLLILSLFFLNKAYGQCTGADTVTSNSVSSITKTTAYLTGTFPSNGSITAFTLHYVRVGQTDTINTTAGAFGRNINSLQPNTTYRYYWTTVCGIGNSFKQSGYYTFKTLGDVIYTPMTNAGYQYKYVKVDSALQLALDTLLGRSGSTGGLLSYLPGSGLRVYDGTRFEKVMKNASSDGSVTITNIGDTTVRFGVNTALFPPGALTGSYVESTGGIDLTDSTFSIDNPVIYYRAGVKDTIPGDTVTLHSIGSGLKQTIIFYINSDNEVDSVQGPKAQVNIFPSIPAGGIFITYVTIEGSDFEINDPSSGVNSWTQGGNDPAIPIIGTTTAQPFNVITNSVTRMGISEGGEIFFPGLPRKSSAADSALTFEAGVMKLAPVSGGGGGWSLSGNTATDADFIGNNNDKVFRVAVNGDTAVRIFSNGRTVLGAGTFTATEASYMGYSSLSAGLSNYSVGNYSTTLGQLNYAYSDHSMAAGLGLINKTTAGTAVGLYNDSVDVDNNRLFQIGNGSNNDTRSNVMTVLTNGNVGIGTTTPSKTLEVKGEFRVSDVVGEIFNVGAGGIRFENIYRTPSSNTKMVTWDSVTKAIHYETIPSGGGAGTVTSVGFTGGLISVANATTTPDLTVAGTSGGIPYFSSSSTWASSAALAANALVIGGGAGVAPSTTTTGTGILTFLGTPSSANLRTALTDETGGAGLAVFNSNPTLAGATMSGTLGMAGYNLTGTGLITCGSGTNIQNASGAALGAITFQANGLLLNYNTANASTAVTLTNQNASATGNIADFTSSIGTALSVARNGKLSILTGSNTSIGVSGAMTAGTITISTTAVTASSKIFLTHASVGGTQGVLSVGTITAGTSFVINSSSATDTGTVNWWIVN